MATVRDIIKRSMRMLGVLSVGSEPSAAELADCLVAFNAMYIDLFGGGIGLRLTPKVLTQSTEADGEYNYLASGVTATITLPQSPYRGQRVGVSDAQASLASAPVTVQGNGNLIEGSTSVTMSTNGEARTWYFEPGTGWALEEELEAADIPPIDPRLHESLSALLAVRMASEFGETVSEPVAIMAYQASSNVFSLYGYKSPGGIDPALCGMSSYLYSRSNGFI